MSAGELVMRCFHARTNAHVMHLKSKSYAQHVALAGFYDGIVDLVDSYAEAYQGSHGLIENYPAKFVVFTDPIALLDDLADWVAANRAVCCGPKESHLQNIIDEIVALIKSTKYKLTYLK